MSRWLRVCALADLVPDRGVAALVADDQVALFRLSGSAQEVHAVDHLDPVSDAGVMARGLVGSRQDVPTVASPMHKQTYDLRSGRCLDDPGLSLRVWPARVEDGWVEVLAGPSNGAP